MIDGSINNGTYNNIRTGTLKANSYNTLFGIEYTEDPNVIGESGQGCWIEFNYVDDGAINYIALCSGHELNMVTKLVFDKDNYYGSFKTPYLSYGIVNMPDTPVNQYTIKPIYTEIKNLYSNSSVRPNSVIAATDTTSRPILISLNPSDYETGDTVVINIQANIVPTFSGALSGVIIKYADGYNDIVGTASDVMSYCIMCYGDIFLINRQVYK